MRPNVFVIVAPLGQRAAGIGQAVENLLAKAFIAEGSRRILALDGPAATLAAAFHSPNPAPFADSQIAATAIIHALVIVTRNLRNFDFPGLNILNPWDAV